MHVPAGTVIYEMNVEDEMVRFGGERVTSSRNALLIDKARKIIKRNSGFMWNKMSCCTKSVFSGLPR